MKPGDRVKITQDAFVQRTTGEAVEVIIEGHSYPFWVNSSYIEVIEPPEPPPLSVVVVSTKQGFYAFKRNMNGYWYRTGESSPYMWEYVSTLGVSFQVFSAPEYNNL